MAKKRILVVDDEEWIAKVLQMRLEANGYEVLVAHDGQEGLETAQKEKPDLVLLDRMLPRMDGYKVCGLLKKDARFSSIPIIMLTAMTQNPETESDVPADAYMMKPFDPPALLGKIRELIGE
ncbi:MAG: response regulator [Candidatus Omnitrophica bacterium]|nr:response regulator [Candidatus Omnitrophota bacterium]